MSERPGFMVYFSDVEPILHRFSDKELGEFFRALVCYAKNGEVRPVEGMVSLAFDMVRPKLDRDLEAYRSKCERNRYAAFSREEKRRGNEVPTFEEWRAQSGDTKALQEPSTTIRYQTSQNVTGRSELLPVTDATVNSMTVGTELELKSNSKSRGKGGSGENIAPDPLEETFASVGDSGEFEENKRTAMLKLADYR